MHRALLPLLLVPLLAGCTAPSEPLLEDRVPPGSDRAPRPQDAATPPPSTPPPSTNASAEAANGTGLGAGSDAWNGMLIVVAAQTGLGDGPHELHFQVPMEVNLTVTLAGGTSVGGLSVRVVREEGECERPDGSVSEPILEAEGPSPVTLQGAVPASAYCVWVSSQDTSAHLQAEYHAEAAWVPAEPA